MAFSLSRVAQGSLACLVRARGASTRKIPLMKHGACSVFRMQRCASSMEILGRKPRKKDPYAVVKKPTVKGYVPPSAEEDVINRIGSGDRLGKHVAFTMPDDTPIHSPEYLVLDDADVDEYLQSVEHHFEMKEKERKVKLVAPESKVISVDPQEGGRSTFVYVDTNGGSDADMEREIRLRESDGTLRTATPDERDKYNQVFFPKRFKRYNVPELFKSPEDMKNILQEENLHIVFLDEIIRIQRPHQSAYIATHETVYEDIEERRIYSVLQGTRHWMDFVKYLIAEGQINGLLEELVFKKDTPLACELLALSQQGDGSMQSLKKYISEEGTTKMKSAFKKASAKKTKRD